MVIVEAVIEIEPAVDFTAWPVEDPHDPGFLALSGNMTSIEVGTALAVIFAYNAIPAEPVADLTAETLRRHLAESEALIAPGGLRFRDTATKAEVVPGCCFGLESWRDWQDVAHGDDLWLGHDPSFRLEHGERVVSIWREAGHQASSQILVIELAELHRLLAEAQLQLSGFLTLAARWAADCLPQLAEPLVAALDEHLQITKPLTS
jgi:hypothetical protein